MGYNLLIVGYNKYIRHPAHKSCICLPVLLNMQTKCATPTQQLTLELSVRSSRCMVLVMAILHNASDKCRTDNVDKLLFLKLSRSILLKDKQR